MADPSFLSEVTYTLELRGRRLTFYAMSSRVMLRAQQRLGAPVAAIIAGLIAGGGIEEKAAGALLEAVGRDEDLAARLVLDALHDEAWAARPATDQAVADFLGRTDGPSLTAMLGAVAAVNAEAFVPLAVGLLAGVRARAEAFASSQSTSSAT